MWVPRAVPHAGHILEGPGHCLIGGLLDDINELRFINCLWASGYIASWSRDTKYVWHIAPGRAANGAAASYATPKHYC